MSDLSTLSKITSGNNQVAGDVDKSESVSLYLTESNQKRSDYLSWNDYFMNVALLSAERSKDPNTQVGACIVDESNKIVGIGYNGMPINCDDDKLPWGKSSPNPLENKYLYVCHAELNAILNKNAADLKNCTLFVTLFPCNECAKVIIQSRISKIWFMSDKDAEKPSAIASKRLLRLAGIKFEQHVPPPITLGAKQATSCIDKM